MTPWNSVESTGCNNYDTGHINVASNLWCITGLIQSHQKVNWVRQDFEYTDHIGLIRMTEISVWPRCCFPRTAVNSANYHNQHTPTPANTRRENRDEQSEVTIKGRRGDKSCHSGSQQVHQGWNMTFMWTSIGHNNPNNCFAKLSLFVKCHSAGTVGKCGWQQSHAQSLGINL